MAAGRDRPTVDSASSRTFFAGFEGLRAVAALLVLVVHTSFASGFTLRSGAGPYTARGEVGVALFFLISGFLLYRPFVASALDDAPGPRLGPFLVRRALRIVPLYWVALTVVYLGNGLSSINGVGGFFQTYFFAQVYSQDWVLRGISQAWSLDIEVVFYLLLPVWAVALRRRRRRRDDQLRVELLALAVVYLVSTAFRWYVLARPSGVTDTWHGWLPSWADMFALGMALAALSAYYQRLGRQPRWAALPGADVACWAAAAVVYVIFSTQVGLRTDPLYVGPVHTELAGHALYGLFAALMLLPAVFGPPRRGPVRRLLTSRPLAYLGLVSYGLYLWHQFVVLQLLNHTGWNLFSVPYWQFLPVAAAVTVALASVSYFVVERPGIAAGHRWIRRRRERLALGGSHVAADAVQAGPEKDGPSGETGSTGADGRPAPASFGAAAGSGTN
jgi:peptidoglycan/LPS O-acetylase OafA/YrhL